MAAVCLVEGIFHGEVEAQVLVELGLPTKEEVVRRITDLVDRCVGNACVVFRDEDIVYAFGFEFADVTEVLFPRDSCRYHVVDVVTEEAGLEVYSAFGIQQRHFVVLGLFCCEIWIVVQFAYKLRHRNLLLAIGAGNSVAVAVLNVIVVSVF